MGQSSNANRIQKGILAIDQQLYDFIENEVLPKVGVENTRSHQRTDSKTTDS